MGLLGPSDCADGVVKQYNLSAEILQYLPRVLRRALHSDPKNPPPEINPREILGIEDKRFLIKKCIFQGSINCIKLETMKYM